MTYASSIEGADAGAGSDELAGSVSHVFFDDSESVS
jgi:hypothetical protein